MPDFFMPAAEGSSLRYATAESTYSFMSWGAGPSNDHAYMAIADFHGMMYDIFSYCSWCLVNLQEF
jgi:hypothetical protein